MAMEADIAEIKTHVLYLRERAEKEERRGDELEDRVTDLEKKNIRTSAWAAGFGAAAAFLFSILKDHLLKLLLAVFVAGCANSGPNGEDAWWHDRLKPVPVYVHEDARPACVDGLIAARELWREKCLVDYLKAPVMVSDEWSGWRGWSGPVGTIAVRDASLERWTLGVAQQRRFGRFMRSCKVEMNTDFPEEQACDIEPLAHELGHCLGLEHVEEADEFDSLMFWVEVPGRELTEDECAWVSR